MTNTSEKKKKAPSKKAQLTEIKVPYGGLNIEARIKDIERKVIKDEEETKRISYQAVIGPNGAIVAIYNDRREVCDINDLKALDPKANIFNKNYRRYYIRCYGIPTEKLKNNSPS